jgi:hypothetical protein
MDTPFKKTQMTQIQYFIYTIILPTLKTASHRALVFLKVSVHITHVINIVMMMT